MDKDYGKKLESYVRSIPDFPEKGIIFRDITTVLQDAEGLKLAIDAMLAELEGVDFDVVVGSGLDGTRTKKEEVVEEALRCLLPEALFQKMTDSKHGEAYNRTREEYNRTKYSSVAMVGDRRFDVEGAKEYCITSIAMSYGYAAPGELDEAGADVIVETVKELGDVLR